MILHTFTCCEQHPFKQCQSTRTAHEPGFLFHCSFISRGFSQKFKGGWSLIFMDYSHEEFTSQGFRPIKVIYFGNNISVHYYNKL